MSMTIPASFTCSYCGEENSTFVDPSQGDHQSYTEDCQICCQPNILVISATEDNDFFIEAVPES